MFEYLGAIIESGSRTAENFSNQMHRVQNGGGSITWAFRAKFVADFILQEIHDSRLTVETCNERIEKSNEI